MKTIEILGMTLTMSEGSEYPLLQFGARSHAFDCNDVYEALDVYAYHRDEHADAWSLDIKRTTGGPGGDIARTGETECSVSGVPLARLADAWLDRASLETPLLYARIVEMIDAQKAEAA
jgi:hypothetical protein